MKSILRFALLVFFVFIITPSAYAQSAAYDRPTVNFMLLKHGDVYDASSAKAFAKVPQHDKFYYNKLSVTDLSLPQLKRSDVSSTQWQPVLTELARQNVARKEVTAWYQRKPDGFMSMSLIHSRGEFNATDDAYNLATTTKRGTEELRDLGSKLISKTYVVVVDFGSITYSANNGTDMHSWSTTVRAYVYKLRYNDDIESQLYDTWIDEGDSEEVITEKQKRFEQIPFEMEYLTQVSASASTNSLMTGKPMKNESGLESVMRMAMSVTSREDLLQQMYQKGYNNVMGELEKKVAAFKVQTGVSALSPIRAKIGKKEGLKTDQRYFIVEYEMDDKGQVKAKRKAVVRAGSHVVDNRTVTKGKTAESNFYQIAGGRVEEGMTLEQRNDAGLSLMLGYGPGLQSKEGQPSQSGGKLRLEMLINKVISLGIPSLYLYGEGEVEFTDYALAFPIVQPAESMMSTEVKKKSYTFSRVGLGLGKGFYFWRNFSLSPYLGVGWEYASANDIPFETFYLKAGMNAAINIYYPLQLVGGLSAFTYLSPHISKSYSGTYDASFSKYSEIFQGRSSAGFGGFLGVRINF